MGDGNYGKFNSINTVLIYMTVNWYTEIQEFELMDYKR